MHSYLIYGTNRPRKETAVKKIIESLSAKTIDFSIEKIADTRELASITKLLLHHPTCIIIKNIDKASVEALNAFLKNLEEPQKNLIYVITTDSINNLLPTIISRCQVISVGSEYRLEDKKRQQIESFLKNNASKKISFINSIRTKDDALSFVKNVIIFSHQNLIKAESSQSRLISTLEATQRLYNYLLGNGNVNLALTNFVLDLA